MTLRDESYACRICGPERHQFLTIAHGQEDFYKVEVPNPKKKGAEDEDETCDAELELNEED
jgi:hypothetical protein